MKKILWLIISISLFCIQLNAAPGDLDTTFDFDGKTTTAIGSAGDQAIALDIQSDGKIVVAGFHDNGSSYEFAIVRYNVDGSLDTAFDFDGIVTTSFGSGNDFARAMIIQSDGKILVAGETFNGSDNDIAIARYNTDGSLDTSFDLDGKVTTPIGVANDVARAITIQPNGKILVTGASGVGSNLDLAVVRYNLDGSLDTSFDSDGKVTTAISTRNDIGNAITIQSDGKIVVTGHQVFGFSDSLIVVSRYNTDGSLDTTFDSDGIVTFSAGGNKDKGWAIAIQADGQILVAGIVQSSTQDIALVRFNTDGSFDTTFDTDGIVAASVGSSNSAGFAMALQSDGKILVSGQAARTGTNADFAVVRFNTDGSIDNAFWDGSNSLWGVGGFANADFFGFSDNALAMKLDSGGRTVVAGPSYDGSKYHFAVARFQGLAPTAASATISGRVLSSGKGRGVSGAIVHLTDQDGDIQTARTNPFGYYRFEDLEVGQTIVLNAYSKRYQFDTRIVNFDDSLTDFDFIAQ